MGLEVEQRALFVVCNIVFQTDSAWRCFVSTILSTHTRVGFAVLYVQRSRLQVPHRQWTPRHETRCRSCASASARALCRWCRPLCARKRIRSVAYLICSCQLSGVEMSRFVLQLGHYCLTWLLVRNVRAFLYRAKRRAEDRRATGSTLRLTQQVVWAPVLPPPQWSRSPFSRPVRHLRKSTRTPYQLFKLTHVD